MKFVDISGFGHSGKGVVTDLLKEFDGYQVPHYNFEFNLIRIQGGLINLMQDLVENWSPIRSNAAIYRFRNVIERIGTTASITKPSSWFIANGMNYEGYFNNHFFEESHKFIEQLVHFSYEGEWPYPMIDEPGYKQFWQRFLLKTKLKKAFKREILVSIPHNFVELCNIYLNNLFSHLLEPGKKVMILHNALEPFNPTDGIRLLGDAKIIVVQRDPRDIFASTLSQENSYVPEYETSRHWQIKRDFLLSSRIEDFIFRQKTLYSQIVEKEEKNVLRVSYEEVILNYEESLSRIYSFLGEDRSVHVNKGKYLIPEMSKNNIGLWKKVNKPEEIRKIENALGEFCYNG